MRAETVKGRVTEALAINEVSVLRQGPQAAKLRVLIDGRERLEELVLALRRELDELKEKLGDA